MDDAADGPAGIVPDGHDVAPVAHGDVALLERRRDSGMVEQALDAGLEVGAERR